VLRVVVMAEARLLAELVTRALAEESRLCVIGVVGDRRELPDPVVQRALQSAEALLYVPDRRLEALPWREELPAARRALVLADLCGQVGPEEARRLGARAYVGRRDGVTTLIERVLQAVSPAAMAPADDPAGRQQESRPASREGTRLLGLKRKESEIVQWLVDGKTVKEIGASLHIREGTAYSRLRRLREKLGLRSLRDLLGLAMQAGLRPRAEEGGALPRGR
jgi:DNA-binding NarL/FixJ family response regulator